MYQVNRGGGTIVDLNDGGPSRAICLDSYAVAKLPDDPLQMLAGSLGDCSTRIERRKGNAIGGTRTCNERRMPATVTYNGSVTPVSFVIHGTVAQGTDETEERLHLGSGNFTIAGKRLGNCSL